MLQLLGEISGESQLMVLLTWRSVDGAVPLAELSESLGRRHATRIPLGGLDSDAVAEVMHSVAGTATSDSQAVQLTGRTDGNPFSSSNMPVSHSIRAACRSCCRTAPADGGR